MKHFSFLNGRLSCFSFFGVSEILTRLYAFIALKSKIMIWSNTHYKFILSAQCTWETGADGNPLNQQFIAVGVKDENGLPVTGLKKSDF